MFGCVCVFLLQVCLIDLFFPTCHVRASRFWQHIPHPSFPILPLLFPSHCPSLFLFALNFTCPFPFPFLFPFPFPLSFCLYFPFLLFFAFPFSFFLFASPFPFPFPLRFPFPFPLPLSSLSPPSLPLSSLSPPSLLPLSPSPPLSLSLSPSSKKMIKGDSWGVYLGMLVVLFLCCCLASYHCFWCFSCGGFWC